MKNNIESIIAFIEKDVGIFAGINKIEELKRLIYEILLINDWALDNLKKQPRMLNFFNKKLQGNKKFVELKKILLELRYPVVSKSEPNFKTYLPALHLPEKELNSILDKDFKPNKIYIQNFIKDFPLTQSILKKFPSGSPGKEALELLVELKGKRSSK